jgi:hypothetical protein
MKKKKRLAAMKADENNYPRYTVGITRKQQRCILNECKRRGGIGFSEMVRRILDGWVERKFPEAFE